jgi:hypothetical protein
MKKYNFFIGTILICSLMFVIGSVKPVIAGPMTNTVTPTELPAPDISLLDGQVTNSDMPDIYGETVAGATVDIFIDGGLTGSTVAGPDGTFSFVPEKPLSEGEHKVTAVAKIDNFVSQKSKEVAVTVDLTPPFAPQITNISSGEKRESGEIEILGKAEPLSKILLKADGREVGTVNADADGKFSIKYTLGEGTFNLVFTAQDKAGNVSQATTIVIEGFRPLTAQKIIEQVSTASSPVGVLAQLLVLASSFGFTNFAIYLYYLISLVVNFLSRKKRATWGYVYDSQKKQPLSLALVRIFDAEYKRLLETQITGADGRFGFLVPEGKYYIIVQRADYKFPSEIVTGKVDGYFGDLYHGEIFQVFEKGAVVKMNVPSDPLKARQGFAALAFAVRTVLRYLNIPIFVIVTGLTLYNFFTVRSLLTMISFGIYVLLFVLMLITERFKRRSFGVVYDEKTREPLALAIVRLFDAKNRLLVTRVTGEDGRFNLFVGPGNYVLKITRENYADTTKSISVSKEFPFAAMDVPMKPKA